MNGVHFHVVSEDGKIKGVLFQVLIGREAQGLVDMRTLCRPQRAPFFKAPSTSDKRVLAHH